MTSAKRSWKLQDFMAHGANVNCLALGKKSGRVLATGGDDKKVNLWAVGNSTCILSLAGHSTPVESVQFGYGEETLSAGCQSGSIKIWNLAEAKVQRTLNGHKATITSIAFHPYGDYLCSGSLDSFIKFWDMRRKGCIYTYRGHTKSINSIKFSPDGQWIASGGEDGVVRIWDLRAGKRISDLTNHTAPVTDVVFHPNDLLLASSSADKTVNFWDLDKFTLCSSTEKSLSTIRCVNFSPNGECLLAGDSEGLKVYGYEPARQYDSEPLGWGKVQDCAVNETQLIGASFNLTNASVHIVDLSLVHPLGTPPPQYSAQTSSVPFSHNTSLRKSFNKYKPETKAKLAAVKPIEENVETDDQEEETFATIGSEVDYSMIFQPHRSLNHSPPPTQRVEDWEVLPTYEQPPYDALPRESPLSTPPLSPVRPQRKISSSQRPSPSLINMNPQELSSPEIEVPPELPSELHISKLYISHPSRTGSPRLTQVSSTPSPVHNMHDPFLRKPERDVDEHSSYVSPFGKEKQLAQVDFEVPTKEHEDVTYTSSNYYTPDTTNYNTKQNMRRYSTSSSQETYDGRLHSSDYADDASEHLEYISRYKNQDALSNSSLANQVDSTSSHNMHPQYHSSIAADSPTYSESRFISNDSLYTPSDTRFTSSSSNTPSSTRFSASNTRSTMSDSRYTSSDSHYTLSDIRSPMSDSRLTSNNPHYTPRFVSNESKLSSSREHGPRFDNQDSNTKIRDYFRNGTSSTKELYHSGPNSILSTVKTNDSGFSSSTLDSFSTSSHENRSSATDQIIPMNLSSPVGLDMEQFLPKTYHSNQGKPNMTEMELLNTIFSGHEKMMAVLRNRQRSLGLVYAAINQKDINAGVDTAFSINDGTVIIDLLKSMIPKRNLWNLELCTVILPVIQDLLQSKYETYITTACDTLNLILRTFGPVIKNNMKWSGSSIGVDISKEERYKKCVKVYNALIPLKNVLIKKQSVPGKLGQTFRELLTDIESIDS